MQFQYFLCEQLGKLPSEIESMDCVQLHWMACYFERKFKAEKRAMEESRSKIRR